MNTTDTRKAVEELEAGDVVVIDDRVTFDVWDVVIYVTEFGPKVKVEGYRWVRGGVCEPSRLERNGGDLVTVR